MQLDSRTQERMDRIRRRIARCLDEGATLTSPRVVALSRLLDRLVLSCYRAS